MPPPPRPPALLTALTLNRGELDPAKLAAVLEAVAGPRVAQPDR